MGTEIELKIGGVSLDYSKNNMGNDYGFLFQEGDESRRRSDAINYDYYAEDPGADQQDLAEQEAAFVRTLTRALPRLQLLGYTIEHARSEYQALIDYLGEMTDDQDAPDTSFPLTFEEFCALASRHHLSSLNSDYVDFDTNERATVAQGRFGAESNEFSRIPCGYSDSYWSEASYFSSKLCILSAPSMLQIFGLNPANANVEVVWQFGPLVNAGWAERENFRPNARRTQSILVATEGASDARIISHALELLRPDVSDFFRFVDVDERHHFWGTGNLVKFAEGLLRIDVHNQVLFVLDNDAEGVDAHRKLQDLKLPRNMRCMVLPELDEFRKFSARGPEGVNACDINGRAAAIECYLDLNLKGYPAAQVLWSNYKKDVDAWQGALEHKESYMRHFLDQTCGSITEGYDTSKLIKLLDAILAEASRLAASTGLSIMAGRDLNELL
jgi:HEPN/Toprim N-terminal domain 1